jgi:hypothetical protein
MNFKNRLKKIEGKLGIKKTCVTTFEVRHDHQEEDCSRQYAEHIAAGGNPDDFFICLIKFSYDA